MATRRLRLGATCPRNIFAGILAIDGLLIAALQLGEGSDHNASIVKRVFGEQSELASDLLTLVAFASAGLSVLATLHTSPTSNGAVVDVNANLFSREPLGWGVMGLLSLYFTIVAVSGWVLGSLVLVLARIVRVRNVIGGVMRHLHLLPSESER